MWSKLFASKILSLSRHYYLNQEGLLLPSGLLGTDWSTLVIANALALAGETESLEKVDLGVGAV